jgi:hypothetical protein
MRIDLARRVPAAEVKPGDVLEWWAYWSLGLLFEVSRVTRHRDGHVTIRGSETNDIVDRGAERLLYSKYPPDAPVWKARVEEL